MLQLLQLGKLLYYVINNECSNANWTEGGGEMYNATLRARLCDLVVPLVFNLSKNLKTNYSGYTHIRNDI